MRWRGRRESSNIEDMRGQGSTGRRGLRMPGSGGGGGKLGIIGTIVVVLAGLYFGVDPSVFLGGGGAPQAPAHTVDTSSPEARDSRAFVATVLADTEDTWHRIFGLMGRSYEEPKLVLFSGSVQSACGFAQSATGPFYCPGDQKVYLDTSFFDELGSRFGAPGDFAQAYVIAHEIGHHVQTLLGISRQVASLRAQASQREGNALSVRQELQADCFAGIWAYHARRSRDLLEAGDIDEALTAATAIGDDRLQKQAQGHVVPDAFTHGSSAQRVRWFRQGMQTGTMDACDTFNAREL
ncbi:neutral zinc metallopeptidase [Emcibacter sp. SYSU 3D8]|uniref:KPN_02809 family neutral zinc metallopeptidase n=1 Tax=Emcibacter sp. SYSU 3D8 TaxID=3133969 RepID=UPI0031FE922F